MNRYKYKRWLRTILSFVPVLSLLTLPIMGNSAYAEQDPVEAETGKAWVGKKAKAFTLPGIDGKPVDVAKSLGKRPVVLVFYRGVW